MGADKLDVLNKRILIFILGDYSSPYSTLLTKVNSTLLCNKRVENLNILLYKSLFSSHFPAYMKNMFSLRSSSYDLRGNCIPSLRKPKTSTYGLNSFSYFSSRQIQNKIDLREVFNLSLRDRASPANPCFH